MRKRYYSDIMDIYWKSDKLRQELEDKEFLGSKYDQRFADKVVQRIREIGSAPSYAQLPPSTGKHPIKNGKKFLYYAVDLPGLGEKRGKYRLLFYPYGDYDFAHIETIVAVTILGIDDYH